jgi:hypothetical protein
VLLKRRRHSAGQANCRGRSATLPVSFGPYGEWARSTSCAGTSIKRARSRSNVSALRSTTNDDDALIEAHYLSGITRCVGGDFVSGCVELEAAIELYGNDVRESHRLLYGPGCQGAALGWLAMARWVSASRRSPCESPQGLAVRARRDPTVSPGTRNGCGGFIYVFRQRARGTDSELPAVLALCAEQGFAYFPCSRLRVPGSQSGLARATTRTGSSSCEQAWRRFALWVPNYC